MHRVAEERRCGPGAELFSNESEKPGIWLFLRKTDTQVENGRDWRGWDGRRGKRKRWHRRKSPISRGRVTGTDFYPHRTQVPVIGPK